MRRPEILRPEGSLFLMMQNKADDTFVHLRPWLPLAPAQDPLPAAAPAPALDPQAPRPRQPLPSAQWSQFIIF